jgi:hypothetical protein
VRGGDTHKQGVSDSFESGEGLSLYRFGKGGNIVARRILVGRTSKVEVGIFLEGRTTYRSTQGGSYT